MSNQRSWSVYQANCVIISLGIENIEIVDNIKSVPHNRSIRVSAIKATLNGVKIVLLPHPGAHISSEAREAAWEFCLPKVCEK